MKRAFILIFLFISSLSFSDTIYLDIGSNDDYLVEEMRVYLISSFLETDHEIINSRTDADWVFEIEVIDATDILYSYLVLLDSKSRNIFLEEFISHTWVSFFPDNFSRASNYFVDYFLNVIYQIYN